MVTENMDTFSAAMNMERKVVAGYWEDEDVQKQIGSWMRTAVGVVESSHIRVMRVADNMRNVAVTEGDKVEAQIKFGWEVDAYPVNEIVEAVTCCISGRYRYISRRVL